MINRRQEVCFLRGEPRRKLSFSSVFVLLLWPASLKRRPRKGSESLLNQPFSVSPLRPPLYLLSSGSFLLFLELSPGLAAPFSLIPGVHDLRLWFKPPHSDKHKQSLSARPLLASLCPPFSFFWPLFLSISVLLVEGSGNHKVFAVG